MQSWALIKRFLREQDGPTAVEYAVMLALIVITCLGTVFSMANATKASFESSTEAIQNAVN